MTLLPNCDIELRNDTMKGPVGRLQSLLGSLIRLTWLVPSIVTWLVMLSVLLRLRAISMAAMRILLRRWCS